MVPDEDNKLIKELDEAGERLHELHKKEGRFSVNQGAVELGLLALFSKELSLLVDEAIEDLEERPDELTLLIFRETPGLPAVPREKWSESLSEFHRLIEKYLSYEEDNETWKNAEDHTKFVEYMRRYKHRNDSGS